MMLVLPIGGIAALVAGLLAILFGIQIKEFSLGNTLIVAGSVGVCTGLILLGLAVVVWELQIIARRLGPGETRVRPILPAGISAAGVPLESEGLLLGGQPMAEQPAKVEPAMPSPPPWHPSRGGRPDAPPPAPEGAARSEATESPRQRRNLLFASTSRKERERAQARTTDPLPSEQRAAVRSEPPASEAPPATFEDAWPKPERRSAEPRRPALGASGSAEPGPAEAPVEPQPPAPPSQPEAAVTVLKSGIVDGMAYSLYSDGSIEAQMPEGMMRFASIDELRAHLDQRP